MNRLPLELLHIIYFQLELPDRASLNRCSKPLRVSTTRLLYLKADKSVHFAMQCEKGAVSVPILSHYLEANTSLEFWTKCYIYNIMPRRSDDHFGLSYKDFQHYEINLLGVALSRKRQAVFDWLLQHKVGVNIQVPRSWTELYWPPLFVALYLAEQDVAMTLLDQGASPIVDGLSMTAIHIAAAANLPYVTMRLVKELDINRKDDRGDTPLIYAIASRHSTRVWLRTLVGLGADVNELTICQGQYVSPLSIACMNSRWDLAMELLELGGDAKGELEVMLNFHDCQPLRPLSRACFTRINFPDGTETQRKIVIQQILEKGADPNMLITYNNGDQPLLIRLIRMKRDWEAACLITNSDFDVEKRDSENMTALQWALCTEYGRPKLAMLLLQRGAQVPAITVQEIAALMNRVRSAKIPYQVFDFLLRHKTLAQSYQILYTHFLNIAPNLGDTETFIGDCPDSVAFLIQEKGHIQLENSDLLECIYQERRKRYKEAS